MPTISVKKLDERAVLPKYGSAYAAGADLYAVTDGEVSFRPGETKMIRTGIAVEIPEGYAGLVYARSGLASKRGLAPATKVGVIDADSRGEVFVALYNDRVRRTHCAARRHSLFEGGISGSGRAFRYGPRRGRIRKHGQGMRKRRHVHENEKKAQFRKSYGGL